MESYFCGSDDYETEMAQYKEWLRTNGENGVVINVEKNCLHHAGCSSIDHWTYDNGEKRHHEKLCFQKPTQLFRWITDTDEFLDFGLDVDNFQSCGRCSSDALVGRSLRYRTREAVL